MRRNAFRYLSIALCIAAGLVLASCFKSKTDEAADRQDDSADRQDGSADGRNETGGHQAAGTTGRIEHETVVKSGDFELKAVVTVPARSADQLVPGAVIVPSSDLTDRDGRFGMPGIVFVPYKDWGDGLADGGVATIRYDKRLVQPYGQKVNVREFSLETYYDDVLAALDVLRGTDGIDPDRLFLIGHGEGAVIVTALLEAKPELKVRGLVLIAPPMLPRDELIIKQHTMRIHQSELEIKHDPNAEERLKPTIDRLKRGLDQYRLVFGQLKEGQSGWPENAVLDGFYESFWRQAVAMYGDTCERIMRLKLPIYIFQGNGDMMTFAEDLRWHERALWGSGHVKITLWDGVGHYLINEKTDRPQPAGGGLPGMREVKHVDPAAVAAIAAWINNPVIPPAPPDTTPPRTD